MLRWYLKGSKNEKDGVSNTSLHVCFYPAGM